MGTRAVVKFFEQHGAESDCICAVYHQHDGGLSEVGYDLADLLHRRKIINGMKFGMDMSQYANGIGCLAAQYVAKVKTNLGGVYMTSTENTQAFNYHVEVKKVDGEEVLHIRAWHFDELLFEGGAIEFLRACSEAKKLGLALALKKLEEKKEVSPTPRSWRMRKAEWLEMNEFAKKLLEGEITIIDDESTEEVESDELTEDVAEKFLK